MKGRISKSLQKVLSSPSARHQLRNSLINGGRGQVVVGSTTYSLRTDVGPLEIATEREQSERYAAARSARVMSDG